ncbi:MAG: 2-hydroxychromene-2-carboxylate isomerase [Pseudomonadota bacterium]|nr:2-hydroxychromene-2-carboxylate isomerase [Pseudomonadota bacterium]
MAGIIDFYFDCISPYSYLAHTQLPDLAARHGREIRYHVVNLAAIKLKSGNMGPTTREMPLKYRYSGVDMQRWAARYGVTITRPAGHEPDRLNKGFFLAEDRDAAFEYVTAAWNRVWRDGGNMGDEALLAAIATDLGWEEEDFLAFTRSVDAGARYEAATTAAHGRGVFGVPTMIIGENIWWGNDRLDFLDEYLAACDS